MIHDSIAFRMSTEQPRGRGLLTVLPMVLVLYLLSVGPAYLFLSGRKGQRNLVENTVLTIYTPVFFVCEQNAALDLALDWYLNQWRRVLH